MCLFIETIKLQHGVLHNLDRHIARMHRTRREVLQLEDEIGLAAHFTIPLPADNRTYRCRITYGAQIEQVTVALYRRRRIGNLRLVDGGAIDYRYKYADRHAIDTLFAVRGDCDDILIIKNGMITDTSYANIALSDGNRWYTPDMPLLEGTMREHLLVAGQIHTRPVRVEDIPRYQRIVLFNALMGFDIRRAIPVKAIVGI